MLAPESEFGREICIGQEFQFPVERKFNDDEPLDEWTQRLAGRLSKNVGFFR
jgi:hypothetical protein